MAYDIIQSFIPGLDQVPYDGGVGAYLGVVGHATDNIGDSADGERSYESRTWQNAFVHFFVDDTKILQVADTNYIAYGAGHTANHAGYVHVELCETYDPVKFAAAYARYTWLLAKLLFDKKLPVQDNVTLLSHAEVSDKWGETNHTDPIAYLKMYGKTWADVVNDVTKNYNAMSSSVVTVYKHTVMGTPEVRLAQAEKYLHDHNPNAPYLAQIYKDEAAKEGIRWDIAFAQSIKETGFFDSAIAKNYNNYAGLGVTGDSGDTTEKPFVDGVVELVNADGKDVAIKFANPTLGIRCQIQHLKAYASALPLNGDCVDPRFKYVQRNKAPYIEDFGSGIWAADPDHYGEKVYEILKEIKAVVVPTTTATLDSDIVAYKLVLDGQYIKTVTELDEAEQYIKNAVDNEKAETGQVIRVTTSESEVSKYVPAAIPDNAVPVQVVVTPPAPPAPVIPQPTPAPEPVVDNDVLSIQKDINRLKVANLVEDGINGPLTTAAVKSLQAILGITVDGVAGPETFNAANAVLAKPLCGLAYKTPIATRYIQWRVGATIDGVFGNQTANAVKTYQSKVGLSADGVVGPMTWAKLIG